jgi:hypothetical protein
MDIASNIHVHDCLLKNRELIRQGDFNGIQGLLHVNLFITTASQRRLRQIIVKKGLSSSELDLEETKRLLDGQPFDDTDYKEFQPLLVVYSVFQIAAVCIDVPVRQELLFGIEVTNLDPFRAKWRRG